MTVSILWFRQDLRLHDNPALLGAAEKGQVLPIFILDDHAAGEQRMGAASRWWLHHSLSSLNDSLNGHLHFYRGDAAAILADLCVKFDIGAVFWNRCYEPWRIERDKRIKQELAGKGVQTVSENGALLWEPWEVCKADGTPYRVFTPFFRKGCMSAHPPRSPLPAPQGLEMLTDRNALSLDALDLLPKRDWGQKLSRHWDIGEKAAQERLETFLEKGLTGYKEGRNYPALPHVSRLSPHLHFGEISPNQIWQAALTRPASGDRDHFLSELGWREFSHSLLYHFPDLPTVSLQPAFRSFPWQTDTALLEAWKQGRTGIPIVDAGMRELWQTGYMHNRMRMVTGSFLVKNLMQHWCDGARWFYDCLVDADLANNSAGWQWIAGCGADAAPYFRIFNPVTQGQKFDPDGSYTRRFVPEIAGLPDKYLFCPWQAPPNALQQAGIVLGEGYPAPIVDLKETRERALSAFQSLKR